LHTNVLENEKEKKTTEDSNEIVDWCLRPCGGGTSIAPATWSDPTYNVAGLSHLVFWTFPSRVLDCPISFSGLPHIVSKLAHFVFFF